MTRSAEGEAQPRLLPDGSLLFVSKRPEQLEAADDHGAAAEVAVADAAALWVLPAAGGEPYRVQREKAGVTAILHESAPVRHWDHDLGPAQVRLFAVDGHGSDADGARAAVRDLTPEPGRARDEQAFEVTQDGSAVIAGWWLWDDPPGARTVLAIVDVTTGRRTALLSASGFDFGHPWVSPAGRSWPACAANWIAGHTDRFLAIVSHAGLWALDQMFGTTDHPMFWQRQLGDPLSRPERYELNSPHRHVSAIRTPMLVIHGDRDYRVPVGEALRLWSDLTRHGVQAKFLYFPDENHWILRPGHATVWYETVLAFLAHHVLGEPWRRPDLL